LPGRDLVRLDVGSLRRRRREGLPQSGARLRRYVSVLKIVAYKPRSKSALDSYTAILPHLRVCSFTRFNLDFVTFPPQGRGTRATRVDAQLVKSETSTNRIAIDVRCHHLSLRGRPAGHA
jgi:hypothetical protein